LLVLLVSQRLLTMPLPGTEPFKGSVQFQFTVTFVLFQPAAFGAGESVGLATGPVVSGWIL
jgi:hypothetical protein